MTCLQQKKTFGFLSIHAPYGCHRCKKVFKDPVTQKKSWAGCDYENWPLRTKEETYAKVVAWKEVENNKAARERLEKENGTRWSSLHRLPYFDAAKFTVVEPMYNLYLGAVKYLMNL